MNLPFLVPDWSAPAHVRALCTTRGATPADGASRGAFRFFNLGTRVGDDPDAVAANRARLAAETGMQPIFVHQHHGDGVAVADSWIDESTDADAIVTMTRGLGCAIQVADCLPVLLTDHAGRCVAAAHAGWRGLAGGVLENALGRMLALSGRGAMSEPAIGPGEVIAWLGPCIGPGAFEVGADVLDAFVATDPGAGRWFVPVAGSQAKYLASLPGLARQRLRRAGVGQVYGNDGSDGWCTVLAASRFFSYRRARRHGAPAGRMAACIWLA